MEGGSFFEGFLVGILVAGVVGLLGTNARFFWKRWGQASKTQTVILHTKDTPWQVVVRSLQAGFVLLLMLVALGVAVWLMLQS